MQAAEETHNHRPREPAQASIHKNAANPGPRDRRGKTSAEDKDNDELAAARARLQRYQDVKKAMGDMY